jgi:hypothetical protein
MIYKYKAKVWLYPGMAGWHFITVDKKVSDKVKKAQSALPRRGWGAVKVKVTLGKTSWLTSIFPDKQSGCYLLPLKAEVRRKEDLHKGDTATITLEIK